MKLDLEKNILPDIKISPIKRKKGESSLQPGFNRLDLELTNILEELDNNYFVGTKSALKVFKEFDVDGDGKK